MIRLLLAATLGGALAGTAAAAGSLVTDVTSAKTLVNEGATFIIKARVSNTGYAGEEVRQVAPTPFLTTTACGWADHLVWDSPGGGVVTLLASPVPACTVYLPGSNGAKASHDWFWTFQAVSAGTVAFTVTVTGLGHDLPYPLNLAVRSSADTASITIQRPAVLSATITTSSAGFVTYGATVTVYLEVGNLGDDIAQGVAVLSITPTGAAILTPIGCPPLAINCPFDPARAAADVNPGSSVTWTWLYRADGGGTASVFASAAGVNYTSVLPVTSNTTGTEFLIPAPLQFSLTITGPRTLIPGALARYALRVANLGSTLARLSALPVRLGDDPANLAGAVLELREFGDSLLPADLEPAPDETDTRRFTLVLTPAAGLAPGLYRLRADVTGAERWSGTAGLSWSLPLDVLVVSGRSGFGACGAFGSALSENPWRPAAGPLRYCYVVAPGDADRRVAVRLHTLSGELVRVLEDADRPAGVHEGSWDGTNRQGQRVAAGVYLLLYQGASVRDLRKVAVLQ